MNPVALWLASGESLYPGVALLVLVIIVSPFLKRAWLFRLRNVGAWLALAMIVMACPPFPMMVGEDRSQERDFLALGHPTFLN